MEYCIDQRLGWEFYKRSAIKRPFWLLALQCRNPPVGGFGGKQKFSFGVRVKQGRAHQAGNAKQCLKDNHRAKQFPCFQTGTHANHFGIDVVLKLVNGNKE